MEELIESYGELIRTLSRLSNNHKELLLKCDIERLEKAKMILPKFSQGGAQWQRSFNEAQATAILPHVVGRSEQLPCPHKDAAITPQGWKCCKCGELIG